MVPAACGILLTLQASHPKSSLFTKNTLVFSLPYFALSMSLNVLLTVLLIWRLIYMRHQLKKSLGSDHTRLYTTLATMILESALPYGLISFIFIVLYGTKNTAADLFIPLLVQVEVSHCPRSKRLLTSITNLKCISPMIIILRVARGQAWDNKTVSADHLSSREVVGGRKPSGLGRRYKTQEISTMQFSSGETELSSEQITAQKRTIGNLEHV